MKLINMFGSLVLAGAVGIMLFVFSAGAVTQKKAGPISEPIAEAIIEKLKSEDPQVRLEAFNALGVRELSMMNLVLDAVHGTSCGIEDLERFILSPALGSVVKLLKKNRAGHTDKTEFNDCADLMKNSGQFGF